MKFEKVLREILALIPLVRSQDSFRMKSYQDIINIEHTNVNKI